MKKVLFWTVLAGIALSLGLVTILPGIKKPDLNISESARKRMPDRPNPREIRGQSSKLNGADLTAMNQWKQDVYELVRKYRGQVFMSGDGTEKTVCLTFDDGPDQAVTPKVIDILKSNNVKGTFFFIGERVKRYPAVVSAAYDNGDLVLNHSFTHPRLNQLDKDKVINEVDSTERAIFSVIGQRPALMRPPYGAADTEVVEALHVKGYKTVLWSVDTLDWTGKKSSDITASVLKDVRPGDIILFHSNEKCMATAQALPKIIRGLHSQGYRIINLSEMLAVDAYKTTAGSDIKKSRNL